MEMSEKYHRDVAYTFVGHHFGRTLKMGRYSEQTTDDWELIQAKGIRHHNIARKSCLLLKV